MKKEEIFKDRELYNKLINIVLENKIEVKGDLKNFLLKSDSLNIVRDFLRKDCSDQHCLIGEFCSFDKIKFTRKSYTKLDSSDKKIYIHYTKSLEDAFSIIYMMYYAKVSLKNNDLFHELFTKVFPNVEELRLYEHLKDTYLEDDAYFEIINNFRHNYLIADNAKSELRLRNHVQKYGKINFEKMDSKLYDYYTDYVGYYGIDDYGKSLFGSIVAMYINNKLKNKDMTIDDYKKLRNYINTLSVKDINSVLDLNMDLDKEKGLYVSDDSISKLNKTYKLEIKEFNER